MISVGIYAIAEKGLVIDDFSNLITDPAIVILVLGCGLFFLTFFACVGALRENLCMLQFVSKTYDKSFVFIQQNFFNLNCDSFHNAALG